MKAISNNLPFVLYVFNKKNVGPKMRNWKSVGKIWSSYYYVCGETFFVLQIVTIYVWPYSLRICMHRYSVSKQCICHV